MRILIVKLSAIGDVIHTLPAVALLRRAWPEAHIGWAIESKVRPILESSPVIDELIELDAKSLWQNRLRLQDLKPQQRSRQTSGPINNNSRFDIAIDFQGLMKSGLVAKASGAPHRVGFATNELREKFSRVFLTEQIQTTSITHIIDKNLALARAVIGSTGVNEDAGDYEFPIAIAPEDESYIAEKVLSREARFAILNPGGGWVTKLWDTKNFAAIADWLWEHHQLVSLITYGPGEENLAQKIVEQAITGKAMPFSSTLKQFAALARHAEIFIGGDTGPLHIAAAFRTPIVGLYGPTSPERNGPFDIDDLTVGLDLWCREKCHRRSCWHWQCMDIPQKSLMAAISKRLKSVELREKPVQHPLAFKV